MMQVMAPFSLDTRAASDLRYIRDTIQRSCSFTAVPGYGGILIGVSGIAAGLLAIQQATFAGWLRLWLAEGAVAVTLGVIAVLLKAKKTGEDLWSKPTRKFLLAFAPPVFLGGILTVALARSGAGSVIPGAWLTAYGVAMMGGGAFSVPAVPVMGLSFFCVGCIALLVPSLGDAALIGGFGFLHILFGIIIARRYGG